MKTYTWHNDSVTYPVSRREIEDFFGRPLEDLLQDAENMKQEMERELNDPLFWEYI